MRTLTRIVVCCLLGATALYAQRGMGHGGFGGGFHGGGGGFRGGFGGFNRGFGGFRGGFGGFRGNRLIVNRGFGFRGNWGWPGWGWGWGGWGGWGWPAAYWPGDSGYGYGGYPAYYGTPAPNVTVVYPAQPAPAPVYSESAPTIIHQYDEYGQEVAPTWGASSGSPVYLIALKNHVIYAAGSYSLKGDTVYFVTLQHETKSTPLIMVDLDLSARLNQERNVSFHLP